MNRSTRILSALFVVLSIFCLFRFSSNVLPLTWDEGEMERRTGLATIWINRVLLQIPGVHLLVQKTPELEKLEAADTLRTLFSRDTIQVHWPGTVTIEGHPQWPVMLASLGRFTKATPATRNELRFGPTLFFALVLGVVFYRTRTDFGTETAVFCILAILMIPRLFAHAQIAAWDSTLTASWLLAWAFFPAALKSRRGALFFGVFLGMTLASKFPGGAAVLVFALWGVIRLIAYRCKRKEEPEHRPKPEAANIVARCGIVAVAAYAVFFALNPPLWTNPLTGIGTWVHLNTHRTLNISTLFFGQLYDLHHPLPWYNTFLWTLVTVPSGLLVLAGIGIVAAFREKSQRWGALLLLLNMLVLLVVRACPGTPVHDGVRLFVSAFAFLGIFAGIGAGRLWRFFVRKIPLGKPAVLAVYAFASLNMFWYAPQWLSYYNIFIGGLPGAVRVHMEPTYYWDAFDAEVIRWLEENTSAGERIAFCNGSTRTFELYRNENMRFSMPFMVARPGATLAELREQGIRYYVLQRRSGVMYPRDLELLRRYKPAYVKTIRKGGVGPWDLGSVPILEVYEISPSHSAPIPRDHIPADGLPAH